MFSTISIVSSLVSSTTAVMTTAASRAVEFGVGGIVGRATGASAIFK